jgi:hypothetical protein
MLIAGKNIETSPCFPESAPLSDTGLAYNGDEQVRKFGIKMSTLAFKYYGNSIRLGYR